MKHSELGTHPHPMDDEPEALMPEPVALRPTTTIGAPVDSLDLATVVKMWQAQYRWFLIRLNPLRDEPGRIVRRFDTPTDIQDRKQAEERVQNER